MFASEKIVISGNNFKENQKLQKIIHEHGGDVSLLLKDKSYVCVTTDKFYSYKIKSALKLDIYDSVELKELQRTDDYIVPFPKEQTTKALIRPAPAIVFDIEPFKSDTSSVGKYAIAKYDMRDALNSRLPYFPTEYEIVKSDVLMKDKSFYALELHVAGVGVSEVIAQGSKSGYERSYFRVFVNHGDIERVEQSALECIPTESLFSAEANYNMLYHECIDDMKYSNPHLAAITHVGSEKAKATSFLSLQGQLPEKVKELVMTLYNEATSQLSDILVCSEGIRIDAQGRFNTPFGKLALDQIEEGESLLLQINRLLQDKKETTDKSVELLVKEFHHLIPTCTTRAPVPPNLNQLVLRDLDDLQHMRDVLFICEHLGSQQVVVGDLGNVEKRYLALGCKVNHITERSAEFSSIVASIANSVQGDHKITVNNLYSISRYDEHEAFSKYLPNQKLLFQPCRPGDVLGVLSRGILPTKTGNLGSGMYFVSDASVSVKSSPPNGQSGKRFMIASNVALGIIRKFTTAQPHLLSAPDGFDSVQGVKAVAGPSNSTSTNSRTTEFEEDEFVIFNKHQHHLSYLIDFSSELGDETICAECNALKPTELKLLPVYASEITTEDLPHILPSLELTPPLRVGGVMLRGKPTGDKSGFCPIHLKSSHVTAKIVDLIAEVTLVQCYKSPDNASGVGAYVLPLDANTSVCGLECYINGNKAVLKIQKRSHTKPTIEDDVVEENSDVFNVNLGLIPPGAHVITVLKYVTELPVFSDEIRFVFPSYLTPSREDIEADPSDPLLGCSVQVSIEMPHDISSLTSPTHEIHTKRLHTRGSVTLAGTSQLLAEDFVLCIGLEEPFATRMWLEEDESGHCVSMMTFHPRFEMQTYQETELLFVVDASCSMQTALPDIQRILRSFISKLQTVKAPIKFNIVTFADSITRLFMSSQTPSTSSLQEAWKHVNEMQVHFGGTDVYTPLHAIYLRQFLTQTHTSIFLFTDRHTNQQQKIIELVKQNSTRVRVFTYGVGPTPSRHFIKAVAEAGNGLSSFVLPNKIPNPQMVADQITRAMQPAYCISVKFDTHDKNLIQAPAKIVPIFPGQTRVVFAFAGRCTHANIMTKGPTGRIIESSVHVRESGFVRGSALHCSFVRTLMHDQLEGTLSSTAFMDDHLKRQMIDVIVRLSMQYSMESRFTCFGEPELIELRQEEQPRYLEMVARLKADNLPHLVWKEVEEARLLREAQLETENYKIDLLDAAQRAKDRQSYRDFADVMYKIASLRVGWNIKELRQLGIATRAVVKPVLEQLRDEGKRLALQGNEKESMKLRRARRFIQQELTQFVELLEKEVEPSITSAEDKAYVQKLKERSKKVIARADQDLEETAINLTKRRKVKDRRRTRHHEEEEEEDEAEYEEVFEGPQLPAEEERREEIQKEVTEVETIMTLKNDHKLVKVPSYEEYLINYDKYYQTMQHQLENNSKGKEKKTKDNRNNAKDKDKDEGSEDKNTVEATVFIKIPTVDVPFVSSTVEVNYHRTPKECLHKHKPEDEAAAAELAQTTAADEGPKDTPVLEAKVEEVTTQSLPNEDDSKAKKAAKKMAVDSKKTLRHLMRASWLLRRLKPKFVAPLVDAMTRKTVRAGRHVIRENDLGDYFYIVESGTLEVLKQKPGAPQDQKVGTLTTGSCFGEVALWFNDKRSASVRSTSECVVWAVAREVFCRYTSHMRDQFVRSALRHSNLLSDLTDYERAMINYIGEVRKFDNSFLFREGETLSYFYILIYGSLDGMKGTKKATGFAQMSYHGYKSLTTGAPSKFSVKATGLAEVLLIWKDDFLEYVVPIIHRVASFECMT